MDTKDIFEKQENISVTFIPESYEFNNN